MSDFQKQDEQSVTVDTTNAAPVLFPGWFQEYEAEHQQRLKALKKLTEDLEAMNEKMSEEIRELEKGYARLDEKTEKLNQDLVLVETSCALVLTAMVANARSDNLDDNSMPHSSRPSSTSHSDYDLQ